MLAGIWWHENWTVIEEQQMFIMEMLEMFIMEMLSQRSGAYHSI